MGVSTSKYVFIDTNVLLHYKKPDLIDWKGLCGADVVVLCLCPMVIREVEKHKHSIQNATIRKRAKSIVDWFHSLLSNSPQATFSIGDGVSLELIQSDPLIDFESYGLSKEIQDDHIIASIIQYQKDKNIKCIIASGDIGLRIKVRSHDIEYLHLPDELRLAAEPDLQEIEIKRLRETVARLEARVPKVILSFNNERDYMDISPDCEPMIEQDIENAYHFVEVGTPKLPEIEEEQPAINQTAALATSLFGQRSYCERIREYNIDRVSFLRKYKNYLQTYSFVASRRTRFRMVALLLINSGTATATNIDIEIFFPQTVKLSLVDDLPEYPPKPIPPKLPERYEGPTFGEPTFNAEVIAAALGKQNEPVLHKGPHIKATTNTIFYWLRDLKQHNRFELKPFYISAVETFDLPNFQADFQISFPESPQLLTGKLHFTFPTRADRPVHNA